MTTAVRLRDVVSFLAFAIIIALAFGYFAMLGLRVTPPDDRTKLSMDVPDISNLVVGSNVLLRGVPIGKVDGISTSLDQATINFWVNGSNPVPVDTEVRLENLSTLGESYIALTPRSDGGPVLKDGQRIATETIVQPPSISELAASVTRVLSQTNPDSLKRIIVESDRALPDPNDVLPNLSRTSVLLNNAVNDMKGKGRILLSNFQTLLQNSEWVNPAITALTPSIVPLGVGLQDSWKHLTVNMHRGEPGNITALNALLSRVQALLDDRGGDLKVLGEAFQPKLNLIAASLMNFDTGQILDNFLETVPADGTITLRITP